MSKLVKSFLIVLVLIVIYPLAQTSLPSLPQVFSPPTVKVPLSGTGSMYPTVPKGVGKTDEERAKETVSYFNMYRFTATPSALNRFFYSSKVNHGDIISFQNAITNKIEAQKYGQTGSFIKRVIGLPGETIEIKDGLVFIDNIPLREPYTALPHSTFGGDFLPDCQPMRIPENKVFVMGDNRKESGDSRNELGFISLSDIHYLLPWDKQIGEYDKNFRNTSLDLDPSTKIQTDKLAYLNLLNQKRAESRLPQLKYNPLLEKSALLRANTMLKTNDFSFTATKSGLDQKATMNKADYWNPYYGETWRLGYYSSQELIDSQFTLESSKKFVLDPKFDDIGIGIAEGNLNNCPAQIIVIHYAGYVPPNYSQVMINSWVNTLSNLREVSQTVSTYKTYPDFYSSHKSDIDEITRIINLRLNRLPPLVDKLQKNLWLTDTENKLLEEDLSLTQELNTLFNRLNTKQ